MRTSRKSGFTLAEMISVLLIMAILAAALTSGLANARRKAWRAKARETCRNISIAWNLYLVDMRKFPKLEKNGQELEANRENMECLVDPGKNRLKRTYLEMDDKEKDGGFKDHWGRSFFFSLDTDYDGVVANPYPKVREPPVDKVKASSIAWSHGDPKRENRDDNPIVVW